MLGPKNGKLQIKTENAKIELDFYITIFLEKCLSDFARAVQNRPWNKNWSTTVRVLEQPPCAIDWKLNCIAKPYRFVVFMMLSSLTAQRCLPAKISFYSWIGPPVHPHEKKLPANQKGYVRQFRDRHWKALGKKNSYLPGLFLYVSFSPLFSK